MDGTNYSEKIVRLSVDTVLECARLDHQPGVRPVALNLTHHVPTILETSLTGHIGATEYTRGKRTWRVEWQHGKPCQGYLDGAAFDVQQAASDHTLPGYFYTLYKGSMEFFKIVTQ